MKTGYQCFLQSSMVYMELIFADLKSWVRVSVLEGCEKYLVELSETPLWNLAMDMMDAITIKIRDDKMTAKRNANNNNDEDRGNDQEIVIRTWGDGNILDEAKQWAKTLRKGGVAERRCKYYLRGRGDQLIARFETNETNVTLTHVV